MAQPFIVREEYFGSSMIRRANLTFVFFDREHTELLKSSTLSSLDEALQEADPPLVRDAEEWRRAGMFTEGGRA